MIQTDTNLSPGYGVTFGPAAAHAAASRGLSAATHRAGRGTTTQHSGAGAAARSVVGISPGKEQKGRKEKQNTTTARACLLKPSWFLQWQIQ